MITTTVDLPDLGEVTIKGSYEPPDYSVGDYGGWDVETAVTESGEHLDDTLIRYHWKAIEKALENAQYHACLPD